MAEGQLPRHHDIEFLVLASSFTGCATRAGHLLESKGKLVSSL